MFGGGSEKKDENADHNIVDAPGDNEKQENIKSQTVTDEDKDVDVNEQGEVSGVDDDGGDDELDSEPDDRIHRLSWRNGAKAHGQNPLLRGCGAWSALSTSNKSDSAALAKSNPPSPLLSSSPTRKQGSPLLSMSERYNCAWDALFMEDDAVDDDNDDARIDQLLDLFDAELADGSCSMSGPSAPAPTQEGFTQESELEMIMLTQRGESLVELIVDKIVSDPLQLQSIEAVCPKWRDNIRYALAQRGEPEIRQALERVQRSMKILHATKERVSAVWKRQEAVLQLFETAMLASLSRLESDESRDTDDSLKIANDNKEPVASLFHEEETDMLSPIIEGDESLCSKHNSDLK